jgi:hypothetical protein
MRPGRLALLYRSGEFWLLLGFVLGYASVFFSLVIWLALTLLLRGPNRLRDASMDVALPLAIMIALGVFTFCFLRCRRQRQSLFRELWPHRFMVCPTCIYPLSRGSDRRSECGRKLPRRDVQQFWVGVFAYPISDMHAEARVIRMAANRRWGRGWSRRHFPRSFRLFRRPVLLPLR